MAHAVITVELTEGERTLSPKSVRTLLKEVEALLRSVERSLLSGSDPHTQWGIETITKQSPFTMRMVAENGTGESRAASALIHTLRGLADLQNDVAPRYFNDAALKSARSLGGLVGRPDVAGLRLFDDYGNHAEPSAALMAAVDGILTRPGRVFREPSSIEGRIEKTNVHQRLEFSLFDRLHGFEIKCFFPSELFGKMRDNLGQRVIVVGAVDYDRTEERPVAIDVTDIIPRGPRDDLPLPRLRDLPDFNISGDLSCDEYVRRNRGDDG